MSEPESKSIKKLDSVKIIEIFELLQQLLKGKITLFIQTFVNLRNHEFSKWIYVNLKLRLQCLTKTRCNILTCIVFSIVPLHL